VQRNGNLLTITYNRDSNATDAVCELQESTDLLTWRTVPDTVTAISQGIEEHSYQRDLIGMPQIFFRLHVTNATNSAITKPAGAINIALVAGTPRSSSTSFSDWE